MILPFRYFLLRTALACALISILPAAFAQNAPSAANLKQLERLKRDALSIPMGWPMQVNLLNGDKLHGRMGPVTDDGFALQYLNAGKIEQRTISFSEIKRIYRSNSAGPSKKRDTLLPILLPIVVFAVTFGILAAVN